MTDTNSWNIVQLDREISTGAVYSVHWRVEASRPNPNVSGEFYTTDTYGSHGCTADLKSKSFIPYNNLTKAICVDWVKEGLGEERVAALESGLTASLDELENPTEAAGVPWGKNTVD
tara:strand:+ start:132 stop:482 length:351 start_codon:yes stop_codon:yes gene_type:complete